MRISFLVLVLYAFHSFAANAQDSLIQRNGTYRGVYNYKRSPSPDTSYLRVLFINDTTFAFFFTAASSLHEGAAISPDFNKYSDKGIARLISYHGVKSWVGLMDERDVAGYFAKTDTGYLDVEHVFEFEQAITGNDYGVAGNYQYNTYVILQFNFNGDSLAVNTNVPHSQKYFTAPVFHKIDSKAIKFASSYKLSPANTAFTATVKTAVNMVALPIPESAQKNVVVGHLPAGSQVYVIASYMKYILVARKRNNPQIEKAGWIPRNQLKKVIKAKSQPDSESIKVKVSKQKKNNNP